MVSTPFFRFGLEIAEDVDSNAFFSVLLDPIYPETSGRKLLPGEVMSMLRDGGGVVDNIVSIIESLIHPPD
jgi:hypothetical protein